MRSVHEGARNLARVIAGRDEWLVSRCERKKIAMLFAHPKRILRPDRLRLRGPNGAKDEFHLAAAAQNLRKLAKLIQMPAQPAPALSTATAGDNPRRQPLLLATADFFNSIGRVWTALRWQVAFWSSAFCWLVRPCVRPSMRPFHAPLAKMPFARIRSRP